MKRYDQIVAGVALATATALGASACGGGGEVAPSTMDQYAVQNPGHHEMDPEFWTMGETFWELEAIHNTGCNYQANGERGKSALTEYQREVYPLVATAINVRKGSNRAFILGQYSMNKAPFSVQKFLEETC